MYAIGSRALFLLLLASPCLAADAPALFQSTPNFSNAIAGPGFAVSWSAMPRELTIDDAMTLTIRFDGVANPDRVRRPDLTGRPAFKTFFREIQNAVSPPPDTASVSFTYRLRPRDVSVTAIPELDIAYYSPGSDTVATKYLDTIPLTVKPAVAVSSPVRPLEAPSRFFELPDPRATSTPPGVREWLGLATVLVILPAIGIFVWRRCNPDGARLAKLRRIRSVRTALNHLDRADRSPDPVAAALRAFHGYLAARYGAVAPSPIPSDIARAMVEAKLPSNRIDEVIQLVRDCDAARFAGDSAGIPIPIQRIRQLILAWEESP